MLKIKKYNEYVEDKSYLNESLGQKTPFYQILRRYGSDQSLDSNLIADIKDSDFLEEFNKDKKNNFMILIYGSAFNLIEYIVKYDDLSFLNNDYFDDNQYRVVKQFIKNDKNQEHSDLLETILDNTKDGDIKIFSFVKAMAFAFDTQQYLRYAFDNFQKIDTEDYSASLWSAVNGNSVKNVEYIMSLFPINNSDDTVSRMEMIMHVGPYAIKDEIEFINRNSRAALNKVFNYIDELLKKDYTLISYMMWLYAPDFNDLTTIPLKLVDTWVKYAWNFIYDELKDNAALFDDYKFFIKEYIDKMPRYFKDEFDYLLEIDLYNHDN